MRHTINIINNMLNADYSIYTIIGFIILSFINILIKQLNLFILVYDLNVVYKIQFITTNNYCGIQL